MLGRFFLSVFQHLLEEEKRSGEWSIEKELVLFPFWSVIARLESVWIPCSWYLLFVIVSFETKIHYLIYIYLFTIKILFLDNSMSNWSIVSNYVINLTPHQPPHPLSILYLFFNSVQFGLDFTFIWRYS